MLVISDLYFKMENKEHNPWSFIEQYYPNYSSSDMIARADDLSKVIHEEEEDQDDAYVMLRDEFEGNRETVKEEYNRIHLEIYEDAVEAFQEEEEKRFPNSFANWQETHFEVIDNLMLMVNKDENHKQPEQLSMILTMQGRHGLWELAKSLTDQFELKNKGRKWDGEFYDEIEEFVKEAIK